jgi:aminoglycoside phosphotransferase (APT) family kinase protein
VSFLQSRDAEETGRRLERWLASRTPCAEDLVVENVVVPPSSGFSNETLLFDARWREAGERRSAALVARIKATAFQIFPEYDVERQHRVLALLADTDVPVPRVFGYEPDESFLGAPFFVMERVEGRIPPDAPTYHMDGWMTEVAPEERRSIWWSGIEAMARVHTLDPETRGFGFLAPREGDPLARQLDEYESFLAWAAGERGHPLCERALAWLRAKRPADRGPVRLCWGDARIGNQIFAGGRCVAVLDWEMATLAEPQQDLAWWLFFDRHHSEGADVPRLEGLPSHEETILRWSEATRLSARDVDYYEVFAAFRFSVIMIRVGELFAQSGVLPAESNFAADNTATRMLDKMLARHDRT